MKKYLIAFMQLLVMGSVFLVGSFGLIAMIVYLFLS